MRLKNVVATAVVDHKFACNGSPSADRLIEQGQEEHHRNDNYLCPSLELVGDHLRVHVDADIMLGVFAPATAPHLSWTPRQYVNCVAVSRRRTASVLRQRSSKARCVAPAVAAPSEVGGECVLSFCSSRRYDFGSRHISNLRRASAKARAPSAAASVKSWSSLDSSIESAL